MVTAESCSACHPFASRVARALQAPLLEEIQPFQGGTIPKDGAITAASMLAWASATWAVVAAASGIYAGGRFRGRNGGVS
jgi:hypothetical protein